MIITLLGAPGSGKGTQADVLAERLNIPKISTGDILRAAVAEGSKLGLEAKSIIESGKLVSDKIVIGIVIQRIANNDCNNGFILDGFPRTAQQAIALQDSGCNIDFAIDIEVKDQDIITRVSGRLIHKPSGRIYHKTEKPPKVAGKDDITGEDLVQRLDDKEETVKDRLSIYRKQAQSVIDFYKKQSHTKYISIDGYGAIDNISKSIVNSIDN